MGDRTWEDLTSLVTRRVDGRSNLDGRNGQLYLA